MSKRLSRLFLNSAMRLPMEFREFALKKSGVLNASSMMRNLGKNLYFDFPQKVSIGNNCIIEKDITFRTGALKTGATITLHDNVSVGMNTLFMCISHEIGDSTNRAGENKYGNIVVESGTWIGCNCTILGGVTIGNGCVIGAGSVVIHDCESNCLYAGNPAKKIKKYPSHIE